MLQTIEGIIDKDGNLRFLERIKLPPSRRVILTILAEEPSVELLNLALVSETALAREWATAEEDEAWSHLPQLPLL